MHPFATPVGLALALGLAAGASAQQGLITRSEAQTNQLNRAMLEQQQSRAAAQQNQFEINSLRNELSRPPIQVTPPPVVVGPGGFVR